MGPSATPTQRTHDAVPLPAQSTLLAHALSQTCVPIPDRGCLLQPPAPPSGPKELGMKGDSGKQHLIPASGESSFPGLGWGWRVRNRGRGHRQAGTEGLGGSGGRQSQMRCYQAWNRRQKWSPHAVCLNMPVINQAKELLTTMHSALPP